VWVHPVSEVQTPQFKQFAESLNDYLFSVLKMASNPQDACLPKFEVFFDDMPS